LISINRSPRTSRRRRRHFPEARACVAPPGHAPKYSTVRCARAREKGHRFDSSKAERDKRYSARISAHHEPSTDGGSAGKNPRVRIAPPGRAPADGAAGQAPNYSPIRCVRGREKEYHCTLARGVTKPLQCEHTPPQCRHTSATARRLAHAQERTSAAAMAPPRRVPLRERE